MNFEEYRRAVLEALEVEDVNSVRYFEDYRKAVLTKMGVEFATEDLRNEEHFRLKVLEGLEGGSGGGSSYKLLKSEDITLSFTNTTAASVGTINVGTEAYTYDKIIYVKIRDKQGRRTAHFYGTDTFFVCPNIQSASASEISNRLVMCYSKGNSSGNNLFAEAATYGIYGYSISSEGVLTLYAKYSSSHTQAIDGTFKVDVYVLDPPDEPFA